MTAPLGFGQDSSRVQAVFGAAAWLAIDHSMRDIEDDLDKRAIELTDLILHDVAKQ